MFPIISLIYTDWISALVYVVVKAIEYLKDM